MQSQDKYKLSPQCQELVTSASDLPLERSATGSPIVSYQGLKLHSAVDPSKEALTQLNAALEQLEKKATEAVDSALTCYIIGAGLGYIIKPFSEYLSKKYCKINIIAVELIPEVARIALHEQVWGETMQSVEWIVSAEFLEKHIQNSQLKHTVFISNSASYRVNKSAYDNILQTESSSVMRKPLKILIPTPLYGGSYPIALHCADAFSELGHKVEILDFSDYYAVFKSFENITRNKKHSLLLQNMFASLLGETIVAKAVDFKADLVWAVAQTPLTPTSLQELKAKHIATSLWFVEDYTLFTYWKEVAKYYDAVFTIQKYNFLEELKANGVVNARYLPLAANPQIHRPLNLAAEDKLFFGSNVSFVGAGYYNRSKTFEKLQLSNFKIWGNDWPNNSSIQHSLQKNGERVSTDETVKIFNASKVNLNLHSSPSHSGVNPIGDFVNPRTFEIAACGGFQLMDVRNELAELFDSSEMVTFNDTNELPKLIEYYLEHEEERLCFAQNAQKRVLKEHTYNHRMSEAIDFLVKKIPNINKVKYNPNSIASLKKAITGDEELTAFLSKYEDHEELDLNKIASEIQLGKGELTRAEGIFLLMKEFRDWGVEKGVIV